MYWRMATRGNQAPVALRRHAPYRAFLSHSAHLLKVAAFLSKAYFPTAHLGNKTEHIPETDPMGFQELPRLVSEIRRIANTFS